MKGYGLAALAAEVAKVRAAVVGERNGTVNRAAFNVGWAEPVPLPGMGSVPAFPIGVLPAGMRDFALAVAASTATPVDLPAVAILGALSTVTAGAVEVELSEGWRCPANIYIVPVLEPGEGKTPVFMAVAEPLHAVERDRRDRVAPVRAKAEAEKGILDARCHMADKIAASDATLMADAFPDSSLRTPPRRV